MFRIIQIKDTFKNLFSFKTKLFYVTEPSDWSVKWDGKYITEQISTNYKLKARITTSRFFVFNKILHFGSLNTFIKYSGIVKIHKSNKIILTWFHVTDGDPRIKYIPLLNKKTDYVHTSCQITKNILIKNGLKEEKIITAPIGVDLNLFKPYSQEKKRKLKQELQIPGNKTIIGSFQKDGVGWAVGNEPKLIKGPDIFCDVVEKISKKYPIHILLTGPARGYVKNRLAKAGVSYTHQYLNNYYDIADFYNVLDLYIVTSRAEGGPKAITESMACGVPVVSTRVGMAPEILINGKNGFLSEPEDTETLVKHSINLIENKELKEKLIIQALYDVKNYTWQITADILYEKIYRKLL